MHVRNAGLFLVMLFLSGFPGWILAENASMEVEELRLVVRALRAENESLRARGEVLAGELIRLRRLLEEMRVAASASETPGEAPAPPPEPGFEVTYVNPAWHYLLLAAGTDSALTEGLRGLVFREGVEIAAVTLTRVKDIESVGDVDAESLRADGRYPRAGDRIRFLSAKED